MVEKLVGAGAAQILVQPDKKTIAGPRGERRARAVGTDDFVVSHVEDGDVRLQVDDFGHDIGEHVGIHRGHGRIDKIEAASGVFDFQDTFEHGGEADLLQRVALRGRLADHCDAGHAGSRGRNKIPRGHAGKMPAKKTLTKIRIFNRERAPFDFHRAKESDRLTVAGEPQTSLQRAKKKQRPKNNKDQASEDDFAVLQGSEGNTRELKAPRGEGSSIED